MFIILFNFRLEAISTNIGDGNDAGQNKTAPDCDTVVPTVILNRELMVDHEYAYFQNDGDDVQQNKDSFIKHVL